MLIENQKVFTIFFILGVAPGLYQGRAMPSDTNAVDKIYIGVSNTCRVIMKTYSHDRSLLKETDKLVVFWHDPLGRRSLQIDEAVKSIAKSKSINNRSATVITIHGFNDDAESALPAAIVDGYLRKGKYNVIMLDSRNITTGQYMRAAYMSQLIGKRYAKFISDLINATGLRAKNIHIVGISLGAQTAGWTGRFFRRMTGQKIQRITGLDPAGPCFTYADTNESLHKDDAAYVDVIHVNKGVQGVLEPIGHADYFVNGGGPNQPGCYGTSCSHHRAELLFIESLYNGSTLLGRKCDTWQNFMNSKCNKNEISEMGFNSSRKTRGSYFLRTNSEQPFGMGLAGAVPVATNIFSRILTNFISSTAILQLLTL